MATELSPYSPRLAARGLTVSRNGLPIIRGKDLHLEAGQLIWLGAPSGTGKTTLLLALARLLPRDGGELYLEGIPTGQIPAPEWRARVLLAPHPPLALAETVEAALLVPHRLHQRRGQLTPERTELLSELTALGLGEVDLGQPARRLSQGQLGRLALARALLARPAVLLLDEPTANLDPDAAARVEQRVAAYCADGGAAVVASHGTPWKIPAGTAPAPPTAGGGDAP
ncbi:MAG: ATP-binding cassette domain-containing protein [Deferrisomatales bacterium]|nr:ATP-binding cassette domain-containing protein [Deferrisomatales bacterium]